MLEIVPKEDLAAMDGATAGDDLKMGRDVQLKSELDRLSIGSAFVTFKWSAIICALAGFSAATDGELDLTVLLQ